MNYPTLPKPRIDTTEEAYTPIVKTEFEGNYLQSRRGAKRIRRKFLLDYKDVTLAEFQTLYDFWKNYAGTNVTFTHFQTSEVIECVIVNETLKKEWVTPLIVSTQIELEEI
jgi:hypothetical protein